MERGRALTATALLAGGGLLIFLSQQVSHDLPFARRTEPIGFLLCGVLFFLLGLFVFQSEQVFIWLDNKLNGLTKWMRIQTWGFALMLAGLSFTLITPLASGPAPKMVSPIAAVSAWLLGIASIMVGGNDWNQEKFKLTRKTILWTIGLTVFAFLVRGIATDQIPIILTGDEGSAGINAVDFVKGIWNNIFISGWYSFPSLYFFIQSLSIRVFGQTTEALRIPSAIAGALTVTATYIVGRKMFNERTGLLAALFLSTLHFHIHFSRIGLNNVWDGLWFICVVGALWAAWHTDRRDAYLLTGFGLGISQYFYASGRGLLILVAGVFFAALLFNRKQLKSLLPHLVPTTLTALAVVLPLVWFYVGHPHEYIAPLQRVTIFGKWLDATTLTSDQPAWLVILKQIVLGLSTYTYTPLRAWYTPEAPILLPLAASFFYLGIILLFFQNRNSRLALLILWLAIFGLIGGLSTDTPASQRFVATAPACALILGYGLGESAEILGKIWPKRAKIFVGISFLIITITMANELYSYFLNYTAKSVVDNTLSNGMIAQKLADYLKNKSADTEVVFLGSPFMGYYSIPSIQYLDPQIRGIDITQPWGSVDNPKPDGKKLVFVFLKNHETDIPLVIKDYPGGALSFEKAWDGQVLYWFYEFPGNT